jgi:hypothetical protein
MLSLDDKNILVLGAKARMTANSWVFDPSDHWFPH